MDWAVVWCDSELFRRTLLKRKRPAGAPGCPVVGLENKLKITGGEVGMPQRSEEMVPLTVDVGKMGKVGLNSRDRQQPWFSFPLLVLLIKPTCQFDRLRTEI